MGGLDILVGNAGVLLRKPLAETTDADFARIHAVNLGANFALAREAARLMPRGGRIVFTSSVNQWMPNPGLVAYGSAKAGLGGLARQMALELAPAGVTVNAVAPGTIETELNRAARADPGWRDRKLALIPAGRTGTPEDVAGVILFLCSGLADYVTGTTLAVDGGLSLMGLRA
jgi:NAD(P)-dependent dehydrogenase (short-subunit alcohol dehydrogenase family)